MFAFPWRDKAHSQLLSRAGSSAAATSKMARFVIILAATSKMERFVIMVSSFQPLTIITKRSILDVAAALDPLLLKTFLFQYNDGEDSSRRLMARRLEFYLSHWQQWWKVIWNHLSYSCIMKGFEIYLKLMAPNFANWNFH